MKDKQTIELSKEQYLVLLKAVYLGNWMANANRTGQKGDERHQEYCDISDYLFSLASQFGISEDLERELEGDFTADTSEVLRLQDEYNEESFWDELSHRLGERDFYKKYSTIDRSMMNEEEHFLKLQECIIEWEQALEEKGLDRLEIGKQ